MLLSRYNLSPTINSHMQEMEIASFFVNYMKNDNLGRIALAHVANQGVCDPICLQLAALHSTAVDFAKNGVPAVFTPDLQPSSYPDFMEKYDRHSYPSSKLLGRLYRDIIAFKKKEFDETTTTHSHSPSYGNMPVTLDPALCLLNSTIYSSMITKEVKAEYQQDARGILMEYNYELCKILHQYDLSSEAEVLTGCLITYSKN